MYVSFLNYVYTELIENLHLHSCTCGFYYFSFKRAIICHTSFFVVLINNNMTGISLESPSHHKVFKYIKISFTLLVKHLVKPI